MISNIKAKASPKCKSYKKLKDSNKTIEYVRQRIKEREK